MKNKYSVLATISISHWAVDAACLMMVISLSVGISHAALTIILFYNFLAFATQPLIGFLTDKLHRPKEIAVLGCVLTAIGLLFYKAPFIAIGLIGLGNAFFHVGGGIISLNIERNKTWAPGVFIAPGTLGVFIGTFIGKQYFSSAPFVLLLLILAFFLYHIKLSEEKTLYITNPSTTHHSGKLLSAAVSFILATVVLRSLIGSAVQFQWKKDITLVFLLSFGITLGKALGGILADKYGLCQVPVAGLILSIPCLVLGFSTPLLGIMGMFLFNLTMPVTLFMSAKLFPRFEGFGFGLTVLALSLGSLPVFAGYKLNEGISLIIAVSISIIIYYLGYQKFNKWSQNVYPKPDNELEVKKVC